MRPGRLRPALDDGADEVSMRDGAVPEPAPKDHLEPELTSFVGRERELADLGELMAAGRPLVTIVGPPGIGKTRLALRHATARRVALEAEGGVWWCVLAAASDAEGMGLAVARALGISARSPVVRSNAITAVGRALTARGNTLVVLDGIEHLLPAAAEVVGSWIAAAPRVCFLVASRQPLGLDVETVYEVGPLAVPRRAARPEMTDAMELFLERARAAGGRFEPDEEALHSIAEIVRLLNGFPLAIELTASRLSGLHASQLLEQLSRGLRASDRHGEGDRAITMNDAVDRSWELLLPWERAVLSQCSVFQGGFTLGAAEAVASLPPALGAPAVAEILDALRAKSLLHVKEQHDIPDRTRFAMYESIRTFALRRLLLAGEEEETSERHAQYYLGKAIRLVSLDAQGRRRPLRAEGSSEGGNVRAMMDHGAAVSRPQMVLYGAVALDLLGEGQELSSAELSLLDSAIRDIDRSTDPALVGRALGVRATAHRLLGHMAEAEEDARVALGIAAERGDRRQVTALHVQLGEALFGKGSIDAALGHWEKALALARNLGDHGTEAEVLHLLGAVHQTRGRGEEARRYHEEALSVAVRHEDPRAEAHASLGLGSYFLERGDHDTARLYYDHGLAIARTVGMSRSERVARAYLGLLHFDCGQLVEARSRLTEAVASARALGDVQVEGLFQAVLGAVRAAQGEPDEATERFDSAEDLLAGNVFFLAVARVHRGHLDLAIGRRALVEGDITRASEHFAAAREAIGAAYRSEADARGGPPLTPLVERSDDARIAVRILERAIASDPRPE